MKAINIIYRNHYDKVTLPISALTIGNFDGCHQGHQRIILNTIEYANKNNCISVVITFLPTSKEFFCNFSSKNNYCEQINLLSFDQKVRVFQEMGVSTLVVDSFDNYLSQISHQFYYEKYIKTLNPSYICLGEDFCFGYQKKGDVNFLNLKSKQDNFKFDIVKTVYLQDCPIKSSTIRAFLKDGKIEIANMMLGRSYVLEGVICKGQQLARKLGFPTANLDDIKQLIPQDGIYCGYVALSKDVQFKFSILTLPKDIIPAVFHIRTDHKNDKCEIKVEAHLLSGEYGLDVLYGYRAAYYFVKKIRDRKHFSTMDELIYAIKRDVQIAKQVLCC